MTAAELHERVETWLEAREAAGWFSTRERRMLRVQWLDVTARHGADSAPALGCLLGLVRLAWGHCDEQAVSSEIFRGQNCVTQRLRSSQADLPDRFTAWGSTEAEALVAALEAAP